MVSLCLKIILAEGHSGTQPGWPSGGVFAEGCVSAQE